MDSIDAIFTEKLSNELNKIAAHKINNKNAMDENTKMNIQHIDSMHILRSRAKKNEMPPDIPPSSLQNYHGTLVVGDLTGSRLSPITLSNNSSNSNSDDENISNNLSFSEGTPSIQELINNYVFTTNMNTLDENTSNVHRPDSYDTMYQVETQHITTPQVALQIDIENEMDILLAYFKCQKNMYEQSGYILQYKSTILHSISLFITIGISIVISFINSIQTTIIVVIISNMSICIIIMCTMYLKSESKSTLYLYISKQFDYISESLLHLLDQTKNPNSHQRSIIIQDIENKYNNIIQNYVSQIPYEVNKIYPICCNIAIFTFIKKINNRKQFLINELRKIKVEMSVILKHCTNDSNNTSINQKEKNRLYYLLNNKEVLKTQLKHVKTAYAYMIEILTKECNHAEYYNNNFKRIYFSSKKYYTINYSHCNPFVDEYLDFIIPKKNDRE
jgi:uncharacterized protein YcgL (UPF0745 family)